MKLLDYRAAEVVEVLTASTLGKTGKPRLREIAETLGISERSVYKILARVRALGFQFGFTINLSKLGLSLVISKSKIDEYYLLTQYISVDGAALYMTLVEEANARSHIAEKGDTRMGRLVIGSMPALATLRFLYGEPPLGIDPELWKRMLSLAKEGLSREPPSTLWGRRYSVDRETKEALAYMMATDSLSSIASVAKNVGASSSKLQRKIRSLWRRGAIGGYTVREAPYMPGRGVIIRVDYPDPARLAFAIARIPPVAESILARDNYGGEMLIVRLEGHDEVLASTLKILSELGARAEIVFHYFRKKTGLAGQGIRRKGAQEK